MPASCHYLRSHVKGLLPGLHHVGPGNEHLLTEAELAVRHGKADLLPGDVVVHLSAIQVPDLGGKGGAVLLLGVDEGVHMVVVPQLECVGGLPHIVLVPLLAGNICSVHQA